MILTVVLRKDGALTYGDIWHALHDEAVEWRDAGLDWTDTPLVSHGEKFSPATQITTEWEVIDS